ncbi:TPA: phosphoribosyltransferase [Vibrio parahaemolyticus]|nr:phosphoribosyltransferase [Vibrio parahaemolyticus]HCG7294135.1 phosphoribosyltransferase [Vibrio parahaemolyticus]
MKYPVEIEKKLSEINDVIKDWPKNKNLEDVITWMLQFDNEDFDFAYRIIKNLNVIGPEELNSALAISYSKLMRRAKSKNINISLKNTMFAAIGGASKSGAMIAYNFRLINELASANFLDDESIKYIEQGKIENLVLVDDIIATGDQSAKELQEIHELVIPLGVKNIFVLTAVGMKSGLKKVKDTELAEVFSALEYDEHDTLNSLDSKFYEGLSYEERKATFAKIGKYYGLGYKGVGALITFYYNTPNCTVQSVWNNKYGWLPLFERVSGVTGIDKHYPSLEKATPNPKPGDDKDDQSLTLFVEGKTDEVFYEALAEKYDNFGLKKIDCIPLGLMFSEKLIESLHKLAKRHLLIVESDERMKSRYEKIKGIIGDDKFLEMDEMFSYVDCQAVITSEEFNDYFANDVFPLDLFAESFEADKRMLSVRLIRKCHPENRERNIKIIVEKYLLEDKIQKLIESIKLKYNESKI